MVWRGMGMNGIGNSLQHFMSPLASAALSDRAGFSVRQAGGCQDTADGCRMDPGEYLGTKDRRAWSVSDDLELGGVAFNLSAKFAGFISADGNLAVPATCLPDFLAHPLVASLPHVTLTWPSSPREKDAARAAWGVDPWGAGAVSNGLTQKAMLQRASNWTCKPEQALKVIMAYHMHPLPVFAAALEPHVQRLDRANGSVAAIHVRSGYADHHGRARAESLANLTWPALEEAFSGAAPGVCPAALSADFGGGFLGAMLECASAMARAEGGDDWLVYVAGDVPHFVALAGATLSSHADSAPGALGHVSSNTWCSDGACAFAPRNPGGAWTRTMIDWFMLGAYNVRMLRAGRSSFPTAINARRLWPAEVTEWPLRFANASLVFANLDVISSGNNVHFNDTLL